MTYLRSQDPQPLSICIPVRIPFPAPPREKESNQSQLRRSDDLCFPQMDESQQETNCTQSRKSQMLGVCNKRNTSNIYPILACHMGAFSRHKFTNRQVEGLQETVNKDTELHRKCSSMKLKSQASLNSALEAP